MDQVEVDAVSHPKLSTLRRSKMPREVLLNYFTDSNMPLPNSHPMTSIENWE